ncbi:MAG: hypothetical protein ACRDS0_30935, partial [Pseudonocardiaceae bacterium]
VASAAGWFLQHVQMGSAAHQAAASDMYPVVEAPPSGAVTTGPPPEGKGGSEESQQQPAWDGSRGEIDD